MTAPTTDRPTDTIRDAFEAMLWFLACVIGPLRPRKITPAEEIGALAACEVETDFEPDEPPAPLLALRDLVTRAAEEHNRRALDDWHAREQAKLGGADWTPERIREARERCEPLRIAIEEMTTEEGEDPAEELFQSAREADPGSSFFDAHLSMIDAHRDRVTALRGAWIAAREDLPAALGEIERLTGQLNMATGLYHAEQRAVIEGRDEIERLTADLVTAGEDLEAERRRDEAAHDALRAEIERLTAELATADGATTVAAKALCEWQDRAIAAEAELAARAPADASLEARLADPGRYNCAARSDIVALLATHERLGTGLSTVARICRTALWLLDARAADASRPKKLTAVLPSRSWSSVIEPDVSTSQ